VHAVLLTGGSAFGLDAAGGVMRWLDERGHGLQVGPGARAHRAGGGAVRPVGGRRAHPARRRRPATRPARPRAADPAQGSVGAGAGATVGKLFGIERAMKAASAALR
jgi:L-aminopeptidase/D-esterase-like protein